MREAGHRQPSSETAPAPAGRPGLRQRAVPLLLLAVLPAAAIAHVIQFNLELPAYLGNYPDPDSGIYTLQWTDTIAPGPKANIQLWATRAAFTPFETPDGSLLIAPDISPSSPVNVYDWDTADAGDGCWQPYAIIDDPLEGRTVSKAEGRVTVAHGPNVPPAIWVTTPRAALPDRDLRLQLEWALDEPDDPSVVSVLWKASDGEEGTLVTGLPLSAGTRSATYSIDVRRLPPKPIFLRVTVSSGDGGFCDAWWGGFVTGRPDALPDAGGAPDAGPDAGSPVDAGENPPADGGTTIPPAPRGCGCNSAEGLTLLGMSISLRLLRRRFRATSGSKIERE